jgi:hypothetical protein
MVMTACVRQGGYRRRDGEWQTLPMTSQKRHGKGGEEGVRLAGRMEGRGGSVTALRPDSFDMLLLQVPLFNVNPNFKHLAWLRDAKRTVKMQ